MSWGLRHGSCGLMRRCVECSKNKQTENEGILHVQSLVQEIQFELMRCITHGNENSHTVRWIRNLLCSQCGWKPNVAPMHYTNN